MGGGELIFPEQMLPDERQAAGLLLRHCGDQAQSLLDELAGRLQSGKLIELGPNEWKELAQAA